MTDAPVFSSHGEGQAPPPGQVPRSRRSRLRPPNLPLYVYLVPAALLIGFLTYVPVARTLQRSFYGSTGTSLQGGPYLGSDNYSVILSSSTMHDVALRTAIFVAAVVTASVLLGLYVAALLNNRFFGRKIARVLIILPWAMSPLITAIVYRWLLNSELGYLNSLLRSMGFDANIAWLADDRFVFPALMAVAILVSVPFSVIMFGAAFQAISADIFDAASLDGAGRIRQFRDMALPNMRIMIAVVILLQAIYAFGNFVVVWGLTQGGPAGSTHIVVTYLYEQAFRFLNFGTASAIAVLALAIFLVLSVTYVRTLRLQHR